MTPPPSVPQETGKVSIPTNRQELDGMMLRRQELKNQLGELNDRRSELAAQVSRSGAETVVEIRARLKALDARIARIEADVEASDDAIASALAKGVGRNDGTPVAEMAPLPPLPEIPQVPPPPGFTIEEPGWKYFLRRSMDGSLPLTLASLVLLGVFMYWRISRSMKNQFAALMAMQSSRLEEIQRSVDTMALEVERVSEGQRFVTKVVGDKLPAGH